MLEKHQSLLMKSLKFLSLYLLLASTHHVTRNFKDAFIILSNESILIPYLKTYIFSAKILIFIGFVIFYKQSRLDKLFYMMGGLLILLSTALIVTSGNAFSFTPSLYYVFSSLYSDIAIVMVFWITANVCFTFKEAKIAYPIILCAMPLTALPLGLLYGQLSLGLGDNPAFHKAAHAVIILLTSLSMLQLKYIQPSDMHTDQTSPQFSSISNVLLLTLLTVFAFLATDIFHFVMKTQSRQVMLSGLDYANMLVFSSMYKGYLAVPLTVGGALLAYLLRWRTAAIITPVTLLAGLVVYKIISLSPIEFRETSILHTFKNSSLLSILLLDSIVGPLFSVVFTATLIRAFIPLAEKLKARGLVLAKFLLAGSTLSSGFSAFLVMYSDESSAELISGGIAITMALTLAWTATALVIGKRIQALED